MCCPLVQRHSFPRHCVNLLYLRAWVFWDVGGIQIHDSQDWKGGAGVNFQIHEALDWRGGQNRAASIDRTCANTRGVCGHAVQLWCTVDFKPMQEFWIMFLILSWYGTPKSKRINIHVYCRWLSIKSDQCFLVMYLADKSIHTQQVFCQFSSMSVTF